MSATYSILECWNQVNWTRFHLNWNRALQAQFLNHTLSVSHSLTSVGNVKKQETSSLNKPNKHQESLTQRPRENQEQESRNPSKDPERKHQQTLSSSLGAFATWVQSLPPPSLSPHFFFFFFVFVVWVLFFVGFCLGFKVSGRLGFVLRDFWVSR